MQGVEGGRGARIEVEAIGEEKDDGEHAEPTDLTHEVADFLVVDQNPPLVEEESPVAFVGVDERKGGGAGVGHVGADVEEVFKEPEEREGEAVGLASEEKNRGTEERSEEFGEGAAEKHHGVAERAEERMARFVDKEIGVVEEEETGIVAPGVEEEEEI